MPKKKKNENGNGNGAVAAASHRKERKKRKTMKWNIHFSKSGAPGGEEEGEQKATNENKESTEPEYLLHTMWLEAIQSPAFFHSWWPSGAEHDTHTLTHSFTHIIEYYYDCATKTTKELSTAESWERHIISSFLIFSLSVIPSSPF